jgi:hypothetical protein
VFWNRQSFTGPVMSEKKEATPGKAVRFLGIG